MSCDTVFLVGLQHRQAWSKAYALRCPSFARPKGASGTTDEDFVLPSLRLSVTARNPQDTVRGGAGGGG